MVSRLALGVVVAGLVAGLAAGGVWWQGRRSAARARAAVLSAAAVELHREPLDRAGLVQADRDLATLIAADPHPSLLRSRAEIAIALRLPQDALHRLDDVTFHGRAGTEDLALRARALALRHAVAGQPDDARQATTLALEHFEATRELGSLLLAWQCAVRIDDRTASEAIADRMATEFADAWENKVVQALRAFDPDNAESGATLRQLQLEATLPELETAIAILDLMHADESARARGSEAIQRILGQVPSSKPVRLVAVLACDRQGDVPGRDAHLRWLITNFPQDERVSKWRELLQTK